MRSAADPGTRGSSALLHQICITFSALTGAVWSLSGASCGGAILIVLLDAGVRVGCSRGNIHKPKTLGKRELAAELKRVQVNKA